MNVALKTRISNLVETIINICKTEQIKIAVAESCTGGQLSQVLTEKPGASLFFKLGVITYSNESKIEILGVNKTTIEEHGAVSEQVAKEMGKGINKISNTSLGVAITGIAGPDGGTEHKPVGTVIISTIFHNIINRYLPHFIIRFRCGFLYQYES